MRPDLPVLLWLLSTVSGASPAGSYDDWARPEPTSFHSRGFGYVAEVFPAKSRQNAGRKPICYFYLVGYPGMEWKVSANRVWQAELVNGRMPYEALISMDGVLVTLNEHGHVGYENAVVIYDAKGHLIRSYHLNTLLAERDIAQVDQSVSSRWWTHGAKYYMTKSPSRLYVVLKSGNVLEFSLANGQLRRGSVKDFPSLAEVMRRSSSNEETEVWSTSLRFSSITDVVQHAK
jgi:hypothetical protein